MEDIYRLVMENMLNGNIEKETAKNVIKELKKIGDKEEDIAIIGIAGRYAKSEDIWQFWENICNGENLITTLSQQRREDIQKYYDFTDISYEKIEYQKEAYLSDIDCFDYSFFNITPKEAEMMDPNQRMFLETAYHAIEDAGYNEESVKGSKMGVFVGFSNDLRQNYSNLLTSVHMKSLETAAPGNLSSIIPARLSYYLDLKGPSVTLATSCSSSLVAVHMACSAIIRGECDSAIVGSSKIDLFPVKTEIQLGMEAEDGQTKAFDERGDGTGFGEGVSAIFLKPLKKAESDGDNIYAVIKGSAVNQDGKTAGITVPNANAQTKCIIEAWKKANVNPETISYIETHGTGTRLGDPIEIEGITNAFRMYTDRKQFCAIGSVKNNIGHLYEGAGLASLIKSVMALKHKKIPEVINFAKPNKRIDFCTSPVYINDCLREWERENSPRRCGVSAFGFSGTNCHLILEEYEPKQVKNRNRGNAQFFTFSAKTEKGLKEIVQQYLLSMPRIKEYDIEDISYTNTTGRSHFKYRVIFVADSIQNFQKKLQILMEKGIYDDCENGIYTGICNKECTALSENCNKILEKYIKEGNLVKEDWESFCKGYVQGAHVNWNKMYRNHCYQRVTLPLYPFEKKRCWFLEGLDKDLQNVFTDKKIYSSCRWMATQKEQSTKGISGKLLLLGTNDMSELAEYLENRNISYIAKQIGENTAEELVKIIKKEKFTYIILDYTTSEIGIESYDRLQQSVEMTLWHSFLLLQSISVQLRTEKPNIILAALNVNIVKDDEEIQNPIFSSLFGLARVVNKEWGKKSVYCIDLDQDTKYESWMPEIGTWKDEVIAYRKGQPYCEIIDYIDMSNTNPMLRDITKGGTYVITGGLGALALTVGVKIAEFQKCNIILLHRSDMPEREKWDYFLEESQDKKMQNRINMIRRIEENGSHVMLYQADVASYPEMEKAIKTVHLRFGKISGVFHCAGVAGKGYISEKTGQMFNEVIAPKIYGTWILDELTASDELDFFVLFSSEASILALPGQSDYTAGNCFMDSYARYKGKHFLSINWPSWKEIGMAHENNINEDTILRQISVDHALGVLFKVMHKKLNGCIVGEWTENRFIQNIASIKFSTEISNKMEQGKKGQNNIQKKYDSVQLLGRKNADYTKNEHIIGNIWGFVLGFKEIDIYDSFFELGGDSIQAMRLVKTLSDELLMDIGINEIMNYTSIYDLALYLEHKEGNLNILQEKEQQKGEKYYEASAAQKRLFLLKQLDEKSTNYNLSRAFEIVGKWNLEKLRYAFSEIVKRHESLRTTFSVINGEIMQEIHEDFKISIIELQSDEINVQSDMEKHISSFKLDILPLFRLYVFHAEKKEYLLVDMHHIIIDGTSEAILIKEFLLLYQNQQLLPVNYQYKDFVKWQKDLLTKGKLDNQRLYWKEQLKGEIPILNLPVVQKGLLEVQSKASVYKYKLPECTLSKIKEYASKHEGTLFVVMLSIYYILLYRYTGQADIIVGSPVSGRKNSKFDNTIGVFINTLAFRNTLDESYTFNDVYNNVRKTVFQGIENQEFPLDEIIGELNIIRESGRNPLFDTMFSILNMEKTNISITDTEVKPVSLTNHQSKFHLMIEVASTDEGLEMMWEYKKSLFKEPMIKQMCAAYIRIAESIFNKEQKISDIELLNSAQTQDIIENVNSTAMAYDKTKTVAELIETSVERHMDETALVYHDKEFSYCEINILANKIGRMLEDKGLSLGSKIALVLKRDEWLISCIFACLKIGVAYIPIDPTYPKERVNFILADSRVDMVITNIAVEEAFKTNVKVIYIAEENLSFYNGENLKRKFDSERDAYIIYTSGSTGNPKGVRLPHRAIHNFILGMKKLINFRDGKRILTLTTVSFDIFVLESLVPLTYGMNMIMADEEQQLDPVALGRLIRTKHVKMLQMTPSRAQMLIKYCKDDNIFLDVEEIMLGGENVSIELVEQIKQMSSARIYNMYGPTETTVWSSVSDLTHKTVVDIGKPIANTQIYILNESRKIQPVGIPGELYIAGDGLANGYLGKEKLNKERFVDNPFIEGTKMYKTGDLARYNIDMTIDILGRMDSQVKVRGYRVELEEIEAQIKKFPSIKEAVATVKGKDDGENYIVAYYVSDEKIDLNILRKYLGKNLTDYMMPSHYIQIEQIPTTPNGKTDRKRLPEVAKHQEKAEKINCKENLENVIEREIYEIWNEILQSDQFGIDDNFFEVGGTSIALVKLQAEIEKKYPNKITVTDLFQFTTIKAIAERLHESDSKENAQTKQDKNIEGKSREIAVIGISAKLPSGMDVNSFWEELCKGTDFITDVDEERKMDVHRFINSAGRELENDIESKGFLKGAFLKDIDKFDFEFFKISPREASLMDPNQRLLLETISNTLEDAGYGNGNLNGSKTGVYIGNSDDFGINYRRMVESDVNATDGIALPGNVKSVMAGRIAYMMDFHGPSMVIDTACSSSLVAIDLACRDLREGKCEQAIVGASNLILVPLITKQKIGIEATDNHAKTFDERSDGTGLGEGVISVLLKPLKEAEKDHDHIYAVIKGSAVNQDGRSIGLTAPNANAQCEVLIAACKDAGISGETLGYIEAHGTGTKLGDPIEIQGITKALSMYTEKKQFCGIGSLKTNIGHLDNCAGIAGFLKTVLILKNKKIPPTLYFDSPNKKIAFEKSPVYVNDILADWEEDGNPKRCAVNAFGLSGTNCCVILEAAPEKPIIHEYEDEPQLFTLSAMNAGSLKELVKKYIVYLETMPQESLRDICYTINTGRKDMKYRIAFVVKSKMELLKNLQNYIIDEKLAVK